MKHCKLTWSRFAIDNRKSCKNIELAAGGVGGGLNIAIGSRCPGRSCDKAALAFFVFLLEHICDRHTLLGTLVGGLCHNCLSKVIKPLKRVIVQNYNTYNRTHFIKALPADWRTL